MNWNALKLRTKMIMCVAIPLVLIGAIGIWTFQSSRIIFGSVEHLKNESLVFAGVARQMGTDIIQIQQWLTDISATRGLDGLNDGFDEAEKSYRSFLSGLERFEEMFTKENHSKGLTQTRDLKARVERYYEMGRKMAKSYIEGGPESGNKMMGDFDETAESLSAALEPFLEGQINEVSLLSDKIVSLVDSLKNGVIGVCIISILCSAIIAIKITREILLNLGGEPSIISDIARRISRGDLNVELDSGKKQDTGIFEAMKTMIKSLKKIAGQITAQSNAVAISSDGVSVNATQISSVIDEQSRQVEQTSLATSELSQTIADVAMSAASASDSSRESVETAENGKTVVDQTVTSMMNIAANVEQSSNAISTLGESSKKIGDIIDVINDIASQTNLLALNAAIEAARAGEQGRGFAVVADEVRKLAEKTAQATDEITSMISKIQKDTESSVHSMEKNKGEAEEGVRLVGQARESLEMIVDASRRCMDQVNSIAAATEEQSSAVEEVSSGAESISADFNRTKDASLLINGSTKELAQIAHELMMAVAWFKVDMNAGAQNTLNDSHNLNTRLENSIAS